MGPYLGIGLTINWGGVLDSTPGGSLDTYAQPGGVFTYRQPDGVGLYLQP